MIGQNLGNLVQQLQHLQLQQQQNSANVPLTQDLRSQQEAIINQFLATNTSNQQAKTNMISPKSLPDIDPAILGAQSGINSNTNTSSSSGVTSSIWGDMNNGATRISPSTNVLNTSPPIPLSISPMSNLLQQQQQQQVNKLNASSFAQVAANLDTSVLNTNAANLLQQIQALNNLNTNNQSNQSILNINNTLQMLNDNSIKDKIHSLFEQTKKEEERRRKLEEIQLKVNILS